MKEEENKRIEEEIKEQEKKEKERMEKERKEREERERKGKEMLRIRLEKLRQEEERIQNEKLKKEVNSKYNEIKYNLPEPFYLDEFKLTKLKNSNKDKCSICLENFKEKAQCLYLPCMHLFHSICIMHWLLEHETCPECNLNYKKGGNFTSINDINLESNNQNDDTISSLLSLMRNNLRNINLDVDEFSNSDRADSLIYRQNRRYNFNRNGIWRGRGNFNRGGRGNFCGRGRGNFYGRGKENFYGRDKEIFYGRGKVNSYGRGRGNIPLRGRPNFGGDSEYFYQRDKPSFYGRGSKRFNVRGSRYIKGNRYQNRGRGRRIYQRENSSLLNSSQSSEDFRGSIYSEESYKSKSYERNSNSFDEYYSKEDDFYNDDDD